MIRSFILFATLTIWAIPSYSQDASKSNPKKLKDFAEKFNKRKFLEQIEDKREKVESVARRLKRYKSGNELTVFESDSAMIADYTLTKESFNSVLDTMIGDINSVGTILGFTFFDANRRYEEALTNAETKANSFIENGEKEMKGNVAGLIDLINWVIRIGPLLKNLNDAYLEAVKPIMIERIEKAKFKEWSDII